MTPEQQLLADAALLSFKLNGQFLALAEELARPVGLTAEHLPPGGGQAEELARPVGLTAAWWQVLGAVLPGPLSVAGIAREMGMARQSVQRIADLLVERGMAAYQDNPAHRRAKLVAVTELGREAIRRIDPAHKVAACELVTLLGTPSAARTVAAMRELSEALGSQQQRR